MRRLLLLMAAVLALAGAHVMGVFAQDATPEAGGLTVTGDPTVGTAVSYLGPEGTEVGRVTVIKVVDPLEEYDPCCPPDSGNRFVLLSLDVENTGPRVLPFDPYDVLLQDEAGFLYTPTSINRGSDAADKDLKAGDLASKDQTSGVIGYQVPTAAKLVRIQYTPESGRLILLADLRTSCC